MIKPIKTKFGDDYLSTDELIDALVEKVNELVANQNVLDSDMDVIAELITNHPNPSEHNG